MACRPRFHSARQCVTNNSFYNGASSASSTNVYDRRGQLSEIRESTSYTGPHRASLRVTTLGCYPSRRFPLNSCKSLLFHGGNTGSIPVRDASNSPTTKSDSYRNLLKKIEPHRRCSCFSGLMISTSERLTVGETGGGGKSRPCRYNSVVNCSRCPPSIVTTRFLLIL